MTGKVKGHLYKRTMIQYKFIAECPYDVRALMIAVRPEIGLLTWLNKLNNEPYGHNCEGVLTVIDTVTLEQVRDYMRLVEDGHLMTQTVQPKNQYSGNRDYKIPHH